MIAVMWLGMAAWAGLPEAIFDDLPAVLTNEIDGMELVVTPAGPLPDDLGETHLLLDLGRRDRHVTLAIGGLEARAAVWLARHPQVGLQPAELAHRLVRRQVAHAAAHRADRVHRWSVEDAWSHLSPRSKSGRRAVDQDALAYATSGGTDSRREDLATSIERFVTGDLLPSDHIDKPGCLLPSKWAFIEARVGSPADHADCADLADVGLDPDTVASIDVLFLAASMGSAASIAGHTAVVVTFAPSEQGIVRERAYALQARTGGMSGLRYVVRGVTGGWVGQVDTTGFRTLALRYSEGDDRDVHRYRMRLTDQQKRRVLARLDELTQSYRRPYLFFTRNCQELPRELAEVALGRELDLPTLYAPDTLLGVMAKAELIEWVPPREPVEISMGARITAVRRLLHRAARRVLSVSPAELAGPLARLDARRAGHRQSSYASLADGVQRGAIPQSAWGDVDHMLAWSSTLERAWGGEGLDALRAARVTVRQAMDAARIDRSETPSSQDLLMRAAAPTRPVGTAHTPLRRVLIQSAWRDAGAGLVPWLSVATQLYSSRIGAGRRFRLVDGLEIDLLHGDAQVRLESPLLVRTHWRLFRLAKLRGAATFLNPGAYLQLVELTVQRNQRFALAMRWAEVGGMMELWQADRHRNHLHVSAGASLHTLRDAKELTGPVAAVGAGLPLRGRLRFGLRRQAMSELLVEARYEPVLAIGRTWFERAASLALRLRVGEVAGADVALSGVASVAAGSPIELENARVLQFGLEFEPH